MALRPLHIAQTEDPSHINARKGEIAALITVILWASAFPAIRVSLQGFTPLPLAALRYAVAGGMMLLWLIYKRPIGNIRSVAWPIILCAAIGISLYNVLLNAGEVTTPAGVASFLMSITPAITAALSVIFLKERFKLWAWVGTAISFAGAATISFGQPGTMSWTSGATLVLAAAICHALYFILQKPILTELGGATAAPLLIIAGGACLLPWLPEGLSELSNATSSVAFAAIFLGAFPAALGYFTWSIAQQHLGAARAANFLYLVPPIASVIAFIWTGEIPATITFLGGIIAIAGVAIVNTKGKST
jgi:drug/metabolite transporter (DMT)-like permease